MKLSMDGRSRLTGFVTLRDAARRWFATAPSRGSRLAAHRTPLLKALNLCALVVLTGCADRTGGRLAGADQPNIVIIYADDLGYGDVSSYGATRLSTPNIDALAAGGLRFTDAHASAATCTPSRYSLLTGEYGFRSQAAILPGDAPALIRPNKATLPSVLQDSGYATAVVGKWHLGLGDGKVDWNREIRPGPLDIGFDYAFLLPATGDRVPTVFVENRRVVGVDQNDPIVVDYARKVGDRPTGYDNPDLLRVRADRQHSDTIINGVSRIGHMAGGRKAEWVDEDIPDVLTAKAVSFIRTNRHRPFFLYYPLHDPHVPRLPQRRFQGASGMGPRGDAIVQLDWMTGRIVRELRDLGLTKKTLIIFSSDNGPVLGDGYEDGAAERLGGHTPSGPFRGGKYSAFEAGARVPLVVSWQGAIRPGVSRALVSQVDLFASLSSLVRARVPAGAARDSRDLSPALLGQNASGRVTMLKEAMTTASWRDENWKYIAPLTPERRLPDWLRNKTVETGLTSAPQLYNLATDPRETRNLAQHDPARAKRMHAALARVLAGEAEVKPAARRRDCTGDDPAARHFIKSRRKG